jgi:hypothetical protein
VTGSAKILPGTLSDLGTPIMFGPLPVSIALIVWR